VETLVVSAEVLAVYLRGGSIDKLAEAIGFTGSVARLKMHERQLPLERDEDVRWPATTGAQAEQQLSTALLLDRVEQLRRAQGLTLEQLARASDLSVSTLQRMRARLSDPRLTTIMRLCNGLGVTPGELAGDLPLPTEARLRRARLTADLRPAETADA
jgi:DNA-binding Xre family transcriptional regulator